MKEKEKNVVMEKFKNGDISVLVSTTVVEVGVDVPEATVMLIKNAERFGLAQLHQLRGRVGRGDKESYCILVHGEKISELSIKRLKVMEKENDGFKLAELDLELRGAGDFFGKRQHGFNMFRFIDPVRDKKMIEKVRKEVKALINIKTFDNLDEELIEFMKKYVVKEYDVL
jgi:ATP-dependent DNA helicase RecG